MTPFWEKHANFACLSKTFVIWIGLNPTINPNLLLPQLASIHNGNYSNELVSRSLSEPHTFDTSWSPMRFSITSFTVRTAIQRQPSENHLFNGKHRQFQRTHHIPLFCEWSFGWRPFCDIGGFTTKYSHISAITYYECPTTISISKQPLKSEWAWLTPYGHHCRESHI